LEEIRPHNNNQAFPLVDLVRKPHLFRIIKSVDWTPGDQSPPEQTQALDHPSMTSSDYPCIRPLIGRDVTPFWC